MSAFSAFFVSSLSLLPVPGLFAQFCLVFLLCLCLINLFRLCLINLLFLYKICLLFLQLICLLRLSRICLPRLWLIYLLRLSPGLFLSPLRLCLGLFLCLLQFCLVCLLNIRLGLFFRLLYLCLGLLQCLLHLWLVFLLCLYLSLACAYGFFSICFTFTWILYFVCFAYVKFVYSPYAWALLASLLLMHEFFFAFIVLVLGLSAMPMLIFFTIFLSAMSWSFQHTPVSQRQKLIQCNWRMKTKFSSKKFALTSLLLLLSINIKHIFFVLFLDQFQSCLAVKRLSDKAFDLNC